MQQQSTTLLKNGFFKLNHIDLPEAGIIKVEIELTTAHEIYLGHFPGLPVVPGVCLVQMVKEILALHLDRELQMVKADNIKFMAVVNPVNTPFLIYTITYKALDVNMLQVNCNATWEQTIFFKFAGKYNARL